MPMPLPEERVYYFELRECGNVLLCWIPRAELEAGVVAGRLADAILSDHPAGLDVEVTPADTGYLKARYGLELGCEPGDLLLAFEAIVASREVEVQGEVRGKLVEQLARRGVEEARAVWSERRPISKDQAEVVLKRNPQVQRRVDDELRTIARRSRSGTRSLKARTARALQQIRRTKGEAPAVVFGRLQRQAPRGGK